MVKFTLSVNAGVSMEIGGRHVLVDAFPYDFKDSAFSCLDDELKNKVFAHPEFRNPDVLCYSHLHGDHYSKEVTEEFCEHNPATRLLMPREQVVDFGDICITYYPFTHEGEEYKDVPNFGILVSSIDTNVLFVGDCKVASPQLEELVKDIDIDIFVVDFPWTTLRRGQEFINNILQPKHILVNHLPLEKDDVSGFRKAVNKTINSEIFKDIDIRVLSDPFDIEVFNL